MAGTRTLVVWCPDWPVVAARADTAADAVDAGPGGGATAAVVADPPVAVVTANRVVACSVSARDQGVRRGLRRREAQGRCPDLRVVEANPGRDARTFEPVAASVEAFTTGIEILRPGMVALATRGPSRYFGGDRALAVVVAAAVDAAVAAVDPAAPRCRIGVADGRFAAEQAARLAVHHAAVDHAVVDHPAVDHAAVDHPGDDHPPVLVVAPGGSRDFVAPLPVRSLADAVGPDLVGLLARLGIRTLADLAALPAPSVLARFGPPGEEAHRLARGLDDRPAEARTPPPDLAVSAELDPPAERVDTAAFVARTLAGQLHERLESLGLACTRVAIEAETEHGERLSRLWRHDGTLTPGAIAERVRWQLDGWLSRGETSAGITLLRLSPDEVRPDHGRQLGFWGGRGTDDRTARTLARVQGLLGPDGVVTAVLGGGRDAAAQVRLVAWGDRREEARPGPPPLGAAVPLDVAALFDPGPVPDPATAPAGGSPAGPVRGGRRTRPPELPTWPGRLPGPAPAVVHDPARPAEVLDQTGGVVGVSGRGEVTAAPAAVSVAGGPARAVRGWAGPWPLEERWWDGGRRRARFQVVLDGGPALLLAREAGAWWVEATYD